MRQTVGFDRRILELALHHLVVYHWLTAYEVRGLTREQMLTECVLALAKINKEQFDLLVKEIHSRPAPNHFLNTP